MLHMNKSLLQNKKECSEFATEKSEYTAFPPHHRIFLPVEFFLFLTVVPTKCLETE
jgi:hypothetical protein